MIDFPISWADSLFLFNDAQMLLSITSGAVIGLCLAWLILETDYFRIRLELSSHPRSSNLILRPTITVIPRTLFLTGAVILILIFLSPLFFQYFFFSMPGKSTDFDCDDSALLMLDRFSRLGISATPVLGNLKKNGEAYLESDHVWLLVEVGRWLIPFDWGTQRLSSQYYEGYSLTRSQLLFFVEQDRERVPNQIAAYPQSDEVLFRTVSKELNTPLPHLTAP